MAGKMQRMRLALFIALAATPALSQEGFRTSDRKLEIAETRTLLAGQVVEFHDGSKSRFGEDGLYQYTYTDDGPIWRGEYTVPDESLVCVDFGNGSSRCDLYVHDGTRIVLITADGLRFPVRNISVDVN